MPWTSISRPEPEQQASPIWPCQKADDSQEGRRRWISVKRGVDMDESKSTWPDLGIDDPQRQLSEKWYAITACCNQSTVGEGRRPFIA